MEVFFIKLIQFMLAISLLVLLHEGGHFFFARLFGIRVEKFYLFFDPWFHLFEFKPKNSDTTYGVGWLPLGGYCKICGMVDESMDTEQLKHPAQPWEFRSRPAWQRLLVMIGGVLVNFLLALAIYSACLYTWGEDYYALKDMSQGMKFNQEAMDLGFRDGDILLATDRGELKQYDADLFRTLSTATRVDVLRHGKEVSIEMPGNINLLNMLKSEPRFVEPFTPAIVEEVVPLSLASRMNMKKGCRITSIDGTPISSYNEFTNAIGRKRDMLAAAVNRADTLEALRTVITFTNPDVAGHIHVARFTFASDLRLGIYVNNFAAYSELTHVSYSVMESIPAGIRYGCNVLKGYVSDLKYLASPEGAKSLGGFGTIANLFPSAWDWHTFWLMTALLSIILAFMNIIPIPALDGGHVLFLLYEMITHRQPSEKFMIWAEYIGIGTLMLLMLVANLNDVLRWLGLM